VCGCAAYIHHSSSTGRIRRGIVFKSGTDETGQKVTNNKPDTSVHEPTVQLINCAYPIGIPDAHYMTMLSLLMQDMSIRVLASVIAHIRGGHYTVYMNDTIAAKNFIPNPDVLVTVKNKLTNCGYEQWLEELDT
jgi:hypothetical protein